MWVIGCSQGGKLGKTLSSIAWTNFFPQILCWYPKLKFGQELPPAPCKNIIFQRCQNDLLNEILEWFYCVPQVPRDKQLDWKISSIITVLSLNVFSLYGWSWQRSSQHQPSLRLQLWSTSVGWNCYLPRTLFPARVNAVFQGVWRASVGWIIDSWLWTFL